MVEIILVSFMTNFRLSVTKGQVQSGTVALRPAKSNDSLCSYGLGARVQDVSCWDPIVVDGRPYGRSFKWETI